MTKSEFFELVAEIAETSPADLQDDTLLSSLEGWDSLSVVGFIAAVDRQLHFTPPPADIVKATTIGDLVHLVQHRLAGQ
jgi:acyl carrier protein